MNSAFIRAGKACPSSSTTWDPRGINTIASPFPHSPSTPHHHRGNTLHWTPQTKALTEADLKIFCPRETLPGGRNSSSLWLHPLGTESLRSFFRRQTWPSHWLLSADSKLLADLTEQERDRKLPWQNLSHLLWRFPPVPIWSGTTCFISHLPAPP